MQKRGMMLCLQGGETAHHFGTFVLSCDEQAALAALAFAERKKQRLLQVLNPLCIVTGLPVPHAVLLKALGCMHLPFPANLSLCMRQVREQEKALAKAKCQRYRACLEEQRNRLCTQLLHRSAILPAAQ